MLKIIHLKWLIRLIYKRETNKKLCNETGRGEATGTEVVEVFVAEHLKLNKTRFNDADRKIARQNHVTSCKIVFHMQM